MNYDRAPTTYGDRFILNSYTFFKRRNRFLTRCTSSVWLRLLARLLSSCFDLFYLLTEACFEKASFFNGMTLSTYLPVSLIETVVACGADQWGLHPYEEQRSDANPW